MVRVDSASLIVYASAERAYDALVDPDALARWLPPDGMSGAFETFDLRPGGGYRLVLTYSDSSKAAGKTTDATDVVNVRFVAVEAGARIVQEVDFESDDPAYAGSMTMSWTVRPVDAGALVEVRASGVPPGISESDHVAGMASSLAHLATYLHS